MGHKNPKSYWKIEIDVFQKLNTVLKNGKMFVEAKKIYRTTIQYQLSYMPMKAGQFLQR